MTSVRSGRAALLVWLLAAAAVTIVVLGDRGASGLPVEVQSGLKVAVIGDSDIGARGVAVLELIRDEGADMVIHTGDFDYVDDPAGFEAWINATLGRDFPFFAVVGNHDVAQWTTYRQNLVARLARVPDASCSGDYGVNANCTFRGLSFMLSGVGTLGSGHEAALEASLAADEHTWRLCAWHKNQVAMQAGGKNDEVGWGAYETCNRHGAIIVNGHEHSYSRTKTLVDMDEQIVDPSWPSPGDLRLAPGATFVAVSGLGGRDVRPQTRCLPVTPPYGCGGEWASISSSSNGGTYGALFLEFGVDGNPHKGRGTFKEVNGRIVDSFDMTSELNPTPPTPSPTPVPPLWPPPDTALWYFSIKGRAVIDDVVSVANEDIVAVGRSGPRLFFDGSDVGLRGYRLDAFTLLNDGDIVMSFSEAGSIPGLSAIVDDSDLVRFTPTALGEFTAGVFSLYFDGSDVGLGTDREDIDALDIDETGAMRISTTGRARVRGKSWRDEDVVAFRVGSLGAETAGTWRVRFDGSDVGVTGDIDAVASPGRRLALSMASRWHVEGADGADEDVVDFVPTGLGSPTSGSFLSPLRYNGSRHGIASTDIGGIHIP